MEQFLAVEGGGTKCEALLMSGDGEALAFHAVYPERLPTGGEWGRGRSAGASLAAIRGIGNRIRQGEPLHLIGGSGPPAFQFISDFKIDRVFLWHADESMASRAAAGEPYGLVALAGTGAFANIRLPNLKRHADGYGPLLGDWGGAYQIGREGLRAAMRTHLSPRRKTALLEAVVRAMGYDLTAPNVWGKIIHEGVYMNNDRTAVARFARVVDETARQGDAVALRIIESAADDLFETLEHLVVMAGAGGDDLPLVGTGSVIQKSDIFWNRLCLRARELIPLVRPVRLFLPQVAGLALAGLIQAKEKGLIETDVEQARARLAETLPPLVNRNIKEVA